MILAITGRAVGSLVALSCRRPLLTVLVCAALALLGGGYALRDLTIQTSKLHLLPASQPYVTLFRAYAEDFGTLDDLVVVVRGPGVAESAAFAEALVGRLRQGGIPSERIAYRVDPRGFQGGALLYLPLDRLQRIHGMLAEHRELLDGFLARPTLDELITVINEQMAEALMSQVFDLGLRDSPVAADMRVLRELVGEIKRRLEGASDYRSPWAALLAGGADTGSDGYFVSDDRRLLFIVVTPSATGEPFGATRATIQLIRNEIAGIRARYPAVTAGVTGAPALYNDELAAGFDDSRLATILALALTLALVLLAFRRVGQPLLMLVALGVSLAWSLGVVTLTVGYLTIFSVMFLCIVIGIGIDYGIYFLFRYQEERAQGRDRAAALALTAQRNGPAVAVSIVAAAATFYVLVVTDFRGVREFGFISGTAIVLAGLAMLTLFPALLVLADRAGARPARSGGPPDVPVLERLAARPHLVLIPTLVLAAIAVVVLPGLDVDYNLLKLQARGTESVVWEQTILTTAGWSGFPAVTTAASMAELSAKHAAFARLGAVSEVKSVLGLIPDRQDEKIALIEKLAPLVPTVGVAPPRDLDLERLVGALAIMKRRLDLAETEAPRDLRAELGGARGDVDAVLQRLRGGDRARHVAALGGLQAELYRDFSEKFALLRQNLQPRPITPASLPQELRHRFVGKSGHLLLEVHPRVNIWTREGARRFVEELRSVDAQVTGHPIIAFESIKLMETAYRQGALYAFILVAALAALMIRRPVEAALALVPLVLGTLWGLALMRLCGLTFNLGNVWGIPLVIGAGAEFGLNIVMRFREAREHGGPPLPRSTVASVAFNGLTTIAGFGSLLVAHHQGVWSLGLLLVIGTVTSLIAALIVLPVLLRTLDSDRSG